VLGSCCYGIVRPGPKVQRLSADNKRTVEALQKTPEETASLPAHPGRLLFSPSTWPSAQPKRRGQSLPIPKHCGALPRLPVCCRTRPHSTAIPWRALHDESQLSRQPFSLHPAPLYLHPHLPRNTHHERHQRSSRPYPILPHAPQRVPPSPARIRSISPISAADDDVRASPPEYGPS
jgi:hypothetical protein